MFLHLGFHFFFSGALATYVAATWRALETPVAGRAQ